MGAATSFRVVKKMLKGGEAPPKKKIYKKKLMKNEVIFVNEKWQIYMYESL